MCVTMFTATATPVLATSQTDSIFTIEKTEFENDKITYTISLAPNQTALVGAVIRAEFDSSVLEVASESGAVGSTNSYGEFAANVTGFYEEGITWDNDGAYAVAFMNPNGYNVGASAKKFIKIVFNAIGESRPETEVSFYCEEYITEDGNDENDIKKSDGKQLVYTHSFFTLNPAKNIEVASCVEGLRFTWSEAIGAEWYNIYRREVKADGSFTEWEKLVEAPAGTTEYIDDTANLGTEYYYSVEAANEYGVREYDKTGLIGFNFGTITEVDVALTERGAMVSWGALDNAVSYTVYRRAEGESSWKQVGETSETYLEDEPLTSNVEYAYTVKAHHAKGYTAETSVDPAKLTFIANASINEYQLNKNDIVINWRDVAGAVGYEIYRRATGETEFTLVGTVEIPGYTDEDVIDRNEYSYKVRSLVNLETKEGSVLGEESFDLVKLPITTAVVASLGGDNVTVSWDAVDLAEQYVIYCQVNNNGNWFELATVNATQTKYADRSVKSGKYYSYAIQTKADGMVTALSEASNSVYFLTAPKVAGVENKSNGIEFTFDAVEGASIYNIYRKDANGQFGEPIGTVAAGSELKYLDTTVVSGGIYVYGVQSVYGDVSSGISESKVICFLEEPKVTLENVDGGIKVTWKAVPSAEKYIVYYYGTSKKTENPLAITTTSTSYTYEGGISGRNNYFAVEAICGETISTRDNIVGIYYLDAPELTAADNGTKQITVRWNEVTGVDEYVVLRKLSGESKWVEIARTEDNFYKDTSVKCGKKYVYTVKGYDGEEYTPYNQTGITREFLTSAKISGITSYLGGPKVSWSKVSGAAKYEVYRKTKSSSWKKIDTTSSTSYQDTSAKKGTKYYYAIRSVDGSSKSYYSSSHMDDVAKSVTYKPILKLENTTSTTVKVSWQKVSGAKKYVVYRKAGSDKKWTKLTTTTSTSYTDKKTKNNTTYKYMVKAVDSKSKEVLSSESTTIRCISAPKLSSVKSEKSGVLFKWSKVTGATGYYVYRKTGSGDYEKIATVKGSTNLSYRDKKAKKGKTYTYTVRAYYSSYTSSYRSGLKVKDKY